MAWVWVRKPAARENRSMTSAGHSAMQGMRRNSAFELWSETNCVFLSAREL